MGDVRHLPDAKCWSCGHAGMNLDATTGRKSCPRCGRVVMPRRAYEGIQDVFNEDRRR
jgi:predicted RNA-binding Zn-ribbon protein involved in translation (DUF1610 family)